MIGLCKSSLVFAVLRRLSTTSRNNASHYDVLGITPKATQGDIKSAYYRLSKVYHPDKSSDEESAKKFRAITEAYEVLGNINLKKMYDKGLLIGRENTSRMEYQPEPEPTDPTLKFYKSRNTRQMAPNMEGKTPIYNFDDWSKHHYGDLFKKKRYETDFLRKKRNKDHEAIQSNNQEVLIYMIFAIGGLFMFFVVNGQSNYDQDLIRNKNPEQQHFKEITSTDSRDS